MDMGLSCWSQFCSLPLKPRLVQWLGGCCLQSATGKSQIKPRQWQEVFLALLCQLISQASLLTTFWFLFLLEGSLQADSTGRTMCTSTTPPLQAEQGTKDLTSSFPLGQTLSSTARASTGTTAPALNRNEQPGDKIKHRELDCTLPSSLNELRCTTGGWLVLTYSCFFPLIWHNFIKLLQDCKLCVSTNQTPVTKRATIVFHHW